MAFVRDVIRGKGRSIEEAAMRVFDPKPRDGDMKPPLSREELRARQDRFYAEGRLRIAREAGATGRNRLVYVQSGHGFNAPWLDKPRDYDVLLNYYQEAEADPRADAVVVQAGTKTTAIRRLLAERPECLLRYEAVLFLDDDIELGAADIDALFAALAREKLDLAQAALTADSECAWPFLKRPEAPPEMFLVSTVEIMAPLMTRRALEAVGSAFAETVSGWGTDLLLGPRIRAAFGAGSVGVIGSVAVRHARKVDLAGGALLRLPSPLWNRSGARGQPRRRRLRRRALSAPTGLGRSGPGPPIGKPVDAGGCWRTAVAQEASSRRNADDVDAP